MKITRILPLLAFLFLVSLSIYAILWIRWARYKTPVKAQEELYREECLNCTEDLKIRKIDPTKNHAYYIVLGDVVYEQGSFPHVEKRVLSSDTSFYYSNCNCEN